MGRQCQLRDTKLSTIIRMTINLSSVMKTVSEVTISSAQVFKRSAHASDTIGLLTEKHAQRERKREEEKRKEKERQRQRTMERE
jgi:hypothetical protein